MRAALLSLALPLAQAIHKPRQSVNGPEPNANWDGPSPKSSWDGPSPKSSWDGPSPKSTWDGPSPKSSWDGPSPKSSWDGPSPKSSWDGPSPNEKWNGPMPEIIWDGPSPDSAWDQPTEQQADDSGLSDDMKAQIDAILKGLGNDANGFSYEIKEVQTRPVEDSVQTPQEPPKPAVVQPKKPASPKPMNAAQPTTPVPETPPPPPAAEADTDETKPAGTGSDSAIPNNADVKSICLKTHNDYRRKHGVGALEWDEDLANKAWQWVSQGSGCVMQHTPQGYGADRYGQNLGVQGTSEQGPDEAFLLNSTAKAVDGWYSESRGYNYRSNAQNYMVTGHFTQMVWKTTKRIGCATHYCGTKGGNALYTYYTACNYYPPGNMKNDYVNNVAAPQ